MPVRMSCGTYDWECTALSLLTDTGTDVDEVRHAGWSCWSCDRSGLAEGPNTLISFRSNLRGAQFKSATPRTSVAQQRALESVPVQTGAWRLSIAGNAMAAETPARRVVKRVENCIMTGE